MLRQQTPEEGEEPSLTGPLREVGVHDRVRELGLRQVRWSHADRYVGGFREGFARCDGAVPGIECGFAQRHRSGAGPAQGRPSARCFPHGDMDRIRPPPQVVPLASAGEPDRLRPAEAAEDARVVRQRRGVGANRDHRGRSRTGGQFRREVVRVAGQRPGRAQHDDVASGGRFGETAGGAVLLGSSSHEHQPADGRRGGVAPGSPKPSDRGARAGFGAAFEWLAHRGCARRVGARGGRRDHERRRDSHDGWSCQKAPSRPASRKSACFVFAEEGRQWSLSRPAYHPRLSLPSVSTGTVAPGSTPRRAAHRAASASDRNARMLRQV